MSLKRAIPFILLLGVLALALSGCGGFTSNSNSTSSSSSKAKEQKHVAVTVKPVELPQLPSTYAVMNLPVGENFNGGFFNSSSPWNQTVENKATAPESQTLLRRALERVGVSESSTGPPKLERRYTNAGVYINTTRWTDPIVWGGPTTVVHCRQKPCGEGSYVSTLHIPSNINPDPRYDGWFTVISPNRMTAYDLWRARRLRNGTISYQYMRIWNLSGLGYGEPGQASARGSGLPLFAGIIRPQELEAGQINHALAISVPAPSAINYVQPASVTDGNGTQNSLPEGARIRLKRNIVFTAPIDPITGKRLPMTEQQIRYASAILLALRTYGAIVVGRAAVPTLYAQRDVTSPLLQGNELQALHLGDFEVITLPRERQDEGEER
jgi:hypothetical protein